MSVAQPDVRAAWCADVGEYPTAMECSADGRTVAVGNARGELLLFDTAAGTSCARWQAHDGAVQCISWNARLPQLASGGQDGCLRVWQAPRASLQWETSPARAWVEKIAFNPQGQILASAVGKTLTLFAADDGVVRGVSAEHQSTITDVAWRPNGEQLVTSCYGGIKILLASSAQVRRNLRWQGAMLNLALSPDGKIVASGCQDNSVHFWRLANESNAQMAGYPSKPTALGWSSDGRLLATGGAPSVTVWSFAGKGPEGTRPLVLESHDHLVTALAFAPRGPMLASGCGEGRIAIWEPGQANAPRWSNTLSVAVAHLFWAVCDQSRYLVAADEAGSLSVWQFR